MVKPLWSVRITGLKDENRPCARALVAEQRSYEAAHASIQELVPAPSKVGPTANTRISARRRDGDINRRLDDESK